MKFRKKPVIIDAMQYDGEVNPEIIKFCPTITIDLEKIEIFIPTLEGNMRVSKGDWIIKGVKGEFYPVKPDVFAETYEKVVDELTIDDLKDLAKQSYKFTNAQLFEVEKLFDNETAHIFSAMRVLGCVEAFDDADNSMGHRIFQDLFKTYESYRTISAKCSKMREEDKK